MDNLNNLFEQFISAQKYLGRLSDESLRGYRQAYNLLTKTIPDITPEMLVQSTMVEFFNRLDSRERVSGRGIVKTGIKKSTVATYRSKLNKFFEWLANEKIISKNPFDGIPYPDVQYEDRKFLSKPDVQKIFSALVLSPEWRIAFVRKRNIAIFSALLYTGLRRGELLSLKVFDVDMQRKVIHVASETSKSRMRRAIPINSALTLALQDYIEERRKRGVKCEYFFVSSSYDGPFTKDGLYHLVKEFKQMSGVKFHIHQFRHTFAVNFLNKTGDVAKLRQLLGHRDIRMTSAYLRCLPTSAMRGDVEGITLDNLL